MKTKRPYKPRNPKLTPDRELLKDCHDAMRDAIEEWETSDLPEGFCYCMKHLMILRARIAARLGLHLQEENSAERQSACTAASKSQLRNGGKAMKPRKDSAEATDGRLPARACSACGQFPKLEKTAIPDAMQLSHLCKESRDHDFGEFGEESELISLWNNQQND